MIISDHQTVILGPPGCGKTTSLLALVDQCFQKGIKPHEVAFVSFSKRAAREALERACIKFGFKTADLPFFRTLHSLAFHQLGLRSSEIMTGEFYNKLGDLLQAPFTKQGRDNIIENPHELFSEKKGDVMLFLDSLARSRRMSAEELYDAEHDFKINRYEFIRFVETYLEFRRHYNLLDFTDMLDTFVHTNQSVSTVKVAFIDEAQDLSRLQWEVCQVAFRDCQQVVIAGDDDQAIFSWAGADVASFMSLAGKKLVLAKSHRLPSKIHAFAKEIIEPVETRYSKEFTPREDGGQVIKFRAIEHVPLSHDRSWLWLARNIRSLADFEEHLRKNQQIYQTKAGSSVKPEHVRAIITWERLRAGEAVLPADYQCCLDYIKGAKRLTKAQAASKELIKLDGLQIWHDALNGISLEQREYYLSILRSGRKLTEPPNHIISTIHGAKGMEADVVVLSSAMSARTHDSYMKSQDNERRVFYVGATRAKNTLYLIDDQSPRTFRFPFLD